MEYELVETSEPEGPQDDGNPAGNRVGPLKKVRAPSPQAAPVEDRAVLIPEQEDG